MRPVFAPLALVATLTFAALTAQADTTATPIRTISVTGSAEVRVAPDMATITVGVQAETQDASAALDQASAATASILGRLDAEGIDSSDVRSGSIRLQPRYSDSALASGQRIVGYRAVNTVDVQVRDLDRLGDLLAAVVGNGANRLDRVSFGLQDPNEARDDARKQAVADAIARAGLYAEAAGVTLGEVLTIAEQGNGTFRTVVAEPVVMEMAASSPQFEVPIAPGDVTISASVNMTFAIQTP